MLDTAGLRVQSLGHEGVVYLADSDVYQPGATRAITVEARLFINSYNPLGFGQANILSLMKNWDRALSLTQSPWQTLPEVYGGLDLLIGGADLASALSLGQWHRVNISLNTSGYVVTLDGREIIRQSSWDLANWAGSDPIVLEAGNFDGWIQDVIVKNIRHVAPPRMGEMTKLNDGSFCCSFAGTPGISYEVLTSTNLIDWTAIGFAEQVGPGTFQFTDLTANDFPHRFYRLSVP